MRSEQWRAQLREQRRSIARESTSEQRLDWLEEALQLAAETGALERVLRRHDAEAERPA